MSKYLSAGRKLERQPLLVREVLNRAETQLRAVSISLPAMFTSRVAGEGDVAEMAALYAEVSARKPFAQHDPEFIRAAMRGSTIFYGVWKGERIVALSAADIDRTDSYAEVTDFATLPEYRGHGLTLYLLQQTEENVLPLGIRSVFGNARACSFGMNITFARNGYRFGGTLTNNANINGSLESVNVWHKALPDDPRFAWRHLFEGDSTEDGRGSEGSLKEKK
jgi:putative beta-lysine N-acetyltransferase